MLRRIFRGLCIACMIPVVVTVLTSPAWVVAIGFWFFTINLKAEGLALLTGMVGFALAWPYGLWVKPILEQMGLFP